MSQDESQSGQADSAGGTPPLICGEGRNSITIARAGDVVFVSIGEEVTDGIVVDTAKRAIETGRFADYHGLLIDFTKFVGAIDWGAVHALREMKLWDPGGADAPIAFLVRDTAFGSLVTLAGALFPRARLRLFTEREAALAWIKSPA